MKLFYSPLSPYARKCRILAIEAGINVVLVSDNPNDAASVVGQSNPLGKVPALIGDDGSCVFDSSVIAELFAGAALTLMPAEFNARIAMKTWEALGDGICDAALAARMEGLRKEITEEGRAWISRQRGKIMASLAYASKALADRSFCVGTTFTIADAALISALEYLGARFPDIQWATTYPNLAHYVAAHANRVSVKETKPVVV